MNTRQEKLLHRLKHGPVIIADGGMGTHLYHLGAPHDAVFEYLNIIDPQLVSQVRGWPDLLQAINIGWPARLVRLENFKRLQN